MKTFAQNIQRGKSKSYASAGATNRVEIMIEGTPRALRLVSQLIAQALSLTTEGNTVSATHQKTGAKIIIKRTDISK